MAQEVWCTWLTFCIIYTIYRKPTEKFTHIIDKLDTRLKSVYSTNLQCIICSDMNINYFVEYKRKKLLDAVLTSYNVSSRAYFLTRVRNNSATAVANIFIDTCEFENYIMSTLFNGLSNHNAHLVRINDIDLKILNGKPKNIRKIDKYAVTVL